MTNINVGNFSIELTAVPGSSSRCWVHRIMEGFGLGFDFGPYKAYLVEWATLGDTMREILLFPSDNTAHYLDDWIQGKEMRGSKIIGCIEIKNVTLPPYNPPNEYRAKKAKDAAMWEAIQANDED